MEKNQPVEKDNNDFTAEMGVSKPSEVFITPDEDQNKQNKQNEQNKKSQFTPLSGMYIFGILILQ